MSLKKPTGPYKVGFVDYEWEPPNPCQVLGPPTTAICRIYYPSSLTDEDFMDRRGNWIPSNDYVGCFGYYKGAPGFLSKLVFSVLLGSDKLWAAERAPILEAKLPLIVFSHGIAGFRTVYSNICCDLASHGFIVAATEHRDGSASVSVSYQNEMKTYVQPPGINGPPGETPLELQFRGSQLQHRFSEVIASLNLVESLDLGEQVMNLHPSAAKHQPESFRLQIDRSQVIMMGHSFGGCTAVYSVTQEPRFKALICMDPWMGPLPNEFLERYWLRSLPVHVINSSHWHNEHNWDHLTKVLRKNQEGRQHTRMLTILNTGHDDVSDPPILLPHVFFDRPHNPTDIEVVQNLCQNSIKLFLREIGFFEREEVKLMTREEFTQNPLIRMYLLHDELINKSLII
jgi:platelet-activating factor acetylhydrolase